MTDALPPVCRGWLERWFSREAAAVAERAGAPWSPERLVGWCYLVASTVAREACAVTLRTIGAQERASAHLALPPIVDAASASRAVAVLKTSAAVLRGLGSPTMFPFSVVALLENVSALEREVRQTGAIDSTWLESSFDVAAPLEMALNRMLGAGQERGELLAVLRERLLTPPAA